MKNLPHKLLLACLFTLSFVSFSAGQEAARKTSPREGRAAPSGQKAVVMSPEEKIVRAAYEKLTVLNRAALSVNGDRPAPARDDASVLKFELGNFRVGPLNEIWGAVHSEIKTGAHGEIIRIGRSVTQFNKEGEQVAYNAQWVAGQYASAYDRRWTIGDLLSLEPGRYHDVGEYALYDVAVSFEGKTRAYRALALFHNPYRFAGTLKPEFWDSIVGIGGVLTEVWEEKRPPAGQKKKALGR